MPKNNDPQPRPLPGRPIIVKLPAESRPDGEHGWNPTPAPPPKQPIIPPPTPKK